MDFNLETKKILDKVIAENLPIMIEKHANEMIQDTIRDLFSYGDFKKNLKEKISKEFDVNLINLNLVDYSSLVSDIICKGLMDEANLAPIKDMISSTVGFLDKKSFTLQEIADEFKKNIAEENSGENFEGDITFIVKPDEKLKWVSIYADLDPNIETYNCSVQFTFSTAKDRDGQIFTFKTKQWDESKATKINPSKINRLDSIEKLIFRIYNSRIPITNYNDEIDTEWGSYYSY